MTIDYIQDYCMRGWKVFPARGKKPSETGWQESATTDLDLIEDRAWFEEGEGVAIKTGRDSRLVVLDFDVTSSEQDVEDIIEAVANRVGRLPETFTVLTGTNGAHLYYTIPENIEIPNGTKVAGMSVDVRGDGGYIIAPPSVHPDTKSAYTIADDRPAVELPSEWVQFLQKTQHEPKQSTRKRGTLKRSRVSWTEGERNDQLSRHLYGRYQSLSSAEQLLSVARRVNDERCEPPLSDQEVEGIVDRIARNKPSTKDPFDIATTGEVDLGEVDKLFENYAIVLGRGKPGVIDITDTSFFSFSNAEEAFRHRFVMVPTQKGPRKVNAMKYWIENTHKRYKRLVYRPDGNEGPDELNLWQGYAIEPNPEGNCDLFKQHIEENIGDGNQEFVEFLWDWMADMIQNPEQRLGIVPVLQGTQGVGKSVIGQTLGALYRDQHFLSINSVEALTRRFNTDLAAAQLVLADEAIWGGDRGVQSQLKGLLTEPFITIEPKGMNQYQIPAFFRVLMTSNEDWAAPVERNDRRYVLIPVGSGRRNDRAFFESMVKQLREEGGYGRLLYDLQHRDISNRDWSDRPMDQTQVDMLIRGFDPIERWLYDSLCAVEDGEGVDMAGMERDRNDLLLEPIEIEIGSVRKGDAHQRFKRYASDMRVRSIPSRETFGRKLIRILEFETTRESRPSTDTGKRHTLYFFDNTRQLKERFANYVGVPEKILFEELNPWKPDGL